MPNPLFNTPALKRSFFSKMFGGTPIEEQETLKIKKGTTIILFPGVYHYDDRFWVRPIGGTSSPTFLVEIMPRSRLESARRSFRDLSVPNK
jgi:hypothetical protein